MLAASRLQYIWLNWRITVFFMLLIFFVNDRAGIPRTNLFCFLFSVFRSFLFPILTRNDFPLIILVLNAVKHNTKKLNSLILVSVSMAYENWRCLLTFSHHRFYAPCISKNNYQKIILNAFGKLKWASECTIQSIIIR